MPVMRLKTVAKVLRRNEPQVQCHAGDRRVMMAENSFRRFYLIAQDELPRRQARLELEPLLEMGQRQSRVPGQVLQAEIPLPAVGGSAESPRSSGPRIGTSHLRPRRLDHLQQQACHRQTQPQGLLGSCGLSCQRKSSLNSVLVGVVARK